MDALIMAAGRGSRLGAQAVVMQLPIGAESEFKGVVDLIEIGAGGGSIARGDEMGLLKVGPRSAGADPGPACYGQGGAEPTLTDANLVLGILNPDNFLGGRQRLRVDLAEQAPPFLEQLLARRGERRLA